MRAMKDGARGMGASTLRIETTRIVESTGRLSRILDRMGFGIRRNGSRFFETSL